MADVVQQKYMTHDNEYLIMAEIADDSAINQRGLSKKLGVSLGTINTLINKMARDGKIKMEQVSSKQVAYMLTPKGVVEKAKKTVSYLKNHYRAIYETKEVIKNIIDDMAKSYDTIYIVKNEDEFGAIVDIAIDEYNSQLAAIKLTSIETAEVKKIAKSAKCAVLNATAESIELETQSACEVVDLVERL